MLCLNARVEYKLSDPRWWELGRVFDPVLDPEVIFKTETDRRGRRTGRHRDRQVLGERERERERERGGQTDRQTEGQQTDRQTDSRERDRDRQTETNRQTADRQRQTETADRQTETDRDRKR